MELSRVADRQTLELIKEFVMNFNTESNPYDMLEELEPMIAQASAAPEQEPACYQFQDREGKWHGFADERHQQATIDSGDWPIRKLYTHADPAEVERLRALSVTKIMIDIVPGWDGVGEEVYAKSVADVEKKLTQMGDQIETLEDARNAANQRADAAERMLRELLDCPWVVEEATIPKAGIEAAPQQVVGTMHVALVRLRKARALLSASAEPADQPFPPPKFTVTNLDGKRMGQALLDFGKRLVDGDLTWVSGGVWLHAGEDNKLVLSTCGSDLVVKSAACCTPTAEELQLLANGEYRPEELWGGDRPTCPKCFDKGTDGEVNHHQRELITNLTAIIDEELMPHAHKLPIQNLQRLNETLMDARKVLK